MFSLCNKILPLYRRCSLIQARSVLPSMSSLSKVLKYKAGDKLSGYVVKQVTEISELQLVALRLEHENTGADHLHIARDDKNNLFSVSLKTIPKNSKGVPHILEHLALCGSQQFPCKDPFMKMLTRSLATFMNAFTGCDNTMYPFSTQNPKDFENLLRVYLDAVYFPYLREKDFMQEGWRLDHEEVGNKDSPIIIKGVVFNEMKGVYSDPSQYYTRHLLSKLYPTHAYSHSHGGDPLCIPELSWQELKEFHAEHYHPSNSRFFTYGNFPVESHLEHIDEYVLKKFQRIPVKSEVIPEKPWSQPRENKIYCQFDPMAAIPEKQTTVSLSYLLNDITDTRESFVLGIVGNLLVDGPNAPFYRSLLQSGIGADYSPCTGYDGQLRQGLFSVGLREVNEKDVDLVKNSIETTFDKVVKEGFAKERIEGILHNMELSLKHQTTKFGLRSAMSVNDLWNHGGNPVDALKVNEHVQWFREQLEKTPHFLQDKVDQYFRQNHHRLCLIMTPDKAEETRIKEEESKLLQSKLESLTEADKNKIFNDGIELAKHQQATEDLSCLPTLKITDVEKKMETTPLISENRRGVPIQLCEQPTNGVTYFSALCQIPQLPERLQLLLPLFSHIVTKMGAGEFNYKQFDQEAELKTGGLSASISLSSHPSAEGKFQHNILFSSYSLQKNVEHMMYLWELVFTCLNLNDHDRLSQLIKMTAAELAQNIPDSAHSYAATRASSGLSKCAHLKERMSGLTQVLYMKKLAEMTDYEDVLNDLIVLAHLILKRNIMRCAINTTSECMSSSVSSLQNFISALSSQNPEVPNSDTQPLFSPLHEKCHFVLPFAVNYIGKSLLTKPYAHEDYASLKIATKLLSSKFLHKEIREKGGAYGGGAKIGVGGIMTFYSYRDPNVNTTLDSFNNGVQWLLGGNYSPEYIAEAKLSTFGEIDCPTAPGSKGSSQFLYGISDEMTQNLRERLFAVDKDNIIDATKRHLLQSNYGIALIGPKNDISNSKEWTCLSG